MESPKILYVEDDPMSRDVMAVMLRNFLGITDFTIFEDSSNFLEKVSQLEYAPDVFLLDIHMRPNDGFYMLKELRNHSQYKNKIVVAVTASITAQEVEQLRDTGFDGFIGKPINRQTFPPLLTQLMSGESSWRGT
ncbi:MAG: response regulator [Chloroflexi bacterium]|nr:response regulator [Chloroflexota bacterium]